MEEWTITNLHDADHPFHIHTNAFQVVRVNGVPLAEPVWRDTVNVTRLGSVTIRSRFEDFTGRFVLHCHIFRPRGPGHDAVGRDRQPRLTPSGTIRAVSRM